MRGIAFEKDADGNNRFVRFDLQQYGEQLQPLLEKLGIEQKNISDSSFEEDLKNGVTSEEFLTIAQNMLRKKFDEQSKVS